MFRLLLVVQDLAFSYLAVVMVFIISSWRSTGRAAKLRPATAPKPFDSAMVSRMYLLRSPREMYDRCLASGSQALVSPFNYRNRGMATWWLRTRQAQERKSRSLQRSQSDTVITQAPNACPHFAWPSSSSNIQYYGLYVTIGMYLASPYTSPCTRSSGLFAQPWLLSMFALSFSKHHG